MKTKLFYILPILLVILFSRCTEFDTGPIQSNIEKLPIVNLQTNDPEIYDYLNCQGFDLTKGFFDENYVVLEGDIILQRNQLKSFLLKSTSVENKRISQYVVDIGGISDQSNILSIKFFIDSSVSGIPGDWPGAIRTATADWNNIPNTVMTYTEVFTAGSADLIFYSDQSTNLPNCMRNLKDPEWSVDQFGNPYFDTSLTHAAAEFPGNNEPGRFISINNDGHSENQNNRVTIIRHELGHNLGFRHNNAAATEDEDGDFTACGINSVFGANRLVGTPTNDASSIMVSNLNTTQNINFNSNDKKSASFLHPSGTLYPSYPYNGPMIQTITKNGTLDPLKKDVSATISTPVFHYYKYRIERFNQWSSSALQSTEYSYTSAPTFILNNVPHGTWRFRVSAVNYKGDFIFNGPMMTYTVN